MPSHEKTARRRLPCFTMKTTAGHALCASTPMIFAVTKCCARERVLFPSIIIAGISATIPCGASRLCLPCPGRCLLPKLFSCKLPPFKTSTQSRHSPHRLCPFMFYLVRLHIIPKKWDFSSCFSCFRGDLYDKVQIPFKF